MFIQIHFVNHTGEIKYRHCRWVLYIFFTNSEPNLAAAISESDKSIFDYLSHMITHSVYVFIRHYSEVEILDVVRYLGNTTSVDHHHLSMSVIMNIITSVIQPSTCILLSIINDGWHVPDGI